jgi:chaperonin GroEL
LGRARRVWADPEHFGLVGGKGDARALRGHVADLRAALEHAADSEARQRLRARVGKLMGGAASLWVGAATEAEIEARKEAAGRTAEALRNVVRDGVVPGGGVALLNCRPALQQRLKQTDDLEARAAYRLLTQAMQAPVRTILANAGCEASPVLVALESAGPGYGFDVRCGKVVDMRQAGIWDAAAVLKAAVHGAVASAALALTTDVLVHKKRLLVSFQP